MKSQLTQIEKETQAKIDALNAELEFQQSITKSLVNSKISDYQEEHNTFKVNVFPSRNSFVCFDLRAVKLSDLPWILNEMYKVFSPCTDSYTFGSDQHISHAPLILEFDNGVREQYARLKWHTDLEGFGIVNVWVKFRKEFYSDDILYCEARRVYDSEHHYFPYESHDQINNRSLPRYLLDMFGCKKFWGGNAINFCEDETEAEEFTHVLLNGHTEEFTDFHLKHLEELVEFGEIFRPRFM